MRRTMVVIALAAAVTTVAVAAVARHRSGTQPEYRLVRVARGNVVSTVTATGTVNPVSTVQVGTQVSGQIARLYADFNDRVHKGELIARLDPTLLAEAVRGAQADRDRAAADLAQKQFLLDQAKPLLASQSITQTEYKTDEYNVALSKAALESARSALDRAQQNLRYADIYAPIDGVVIQRNVDVGQTVAASLSAPQLFLIAEDLSKMQILVSVDESDIDRVKEGQTVTFTVPAAPDRTFTGKVEQVRLGSTVTDNVVSYTVVVSVPNPDGALLPGMTATVTFQVAEATNVLEVPNAALRFRPTEAMIAAAASEKRPGDSTSRIRPDSTARRATGQGSPRMVRLWYLGPDGEPRFVLARPGLTDGQVTEIAGRDLREGMEIIAGVLTPTDALAVSSNPFQAQAPTRRRPPGEF